MNSEEHLKPDRRWEIWKCYTHQEYLDRFFIPGKFHKEVPDPIKEAYLSVERLISYSYFYYPLTEEVHSKMTRIFEMAVRMRAEHLGIVIKKKFISLQDYIECFERRDEFDKALIQALTGARKLRNVFAHTKSPQYSGPIGYNNIIYLINLVNRIFTDANTYNKLIDNIKPIREIISLWNYPVMVFETSKNRYLIHSIYPLLMSQDREKSIWMLDPILMAFPQTREQLKVVEPFFVKLQRLGIDNNNIEGFDLKTKSQIRIVPTRTKDDNDRAARFKSEYESADESVRRLYNSYKDSQVYSQLDRFIYEEFWNIAPSELGAQ